MISEKIDNNIIHFYQKVIDKTVLIRYTTDFILKIFAMFYKKQNGNDLADSSIKMIKSIQASLFSKINEFVNNAELTNDNIIDIRFEKDSLVPLFKLYHENSKNDVLFNIFFKKISWDEINEFRLFLVKFLHYYLLKYNQNTVKSNEHLDKIVSDLSYVVQELLQNANAYSFGQFEYELVLNHSNNKFVITVYNFAEEKNVKVLFNIFDELKNEENKNNLILKYMLAEDKHLGLITSIFNYNISNFNAEYIDNKIVKIQFEMDY